MLGAVCLHPGGQEDRRQQKEQQHDAPEEETPEGRSSAAPWQAVGFRWLHLDCLFWRLPAGAARGGSGGFLIFENAGFSPL